VKKLLCLGLMLCVCGAQASDYELADGDVIDGVAEIHDGQFVHIKNKRGVHRYPLDAFSESGLSAVVSDAMNLITVLEDGRLAVAATNEWPMISMLILPAESEPHGTGISIKTCFLQVEKDVVLDERWLRKAALDADEYQAPAMPQTLRECVAFALMEHDNKKTSRLLDYVCHKGVVGVRLLVNDNLCAAWRETGFWQDCWTVARIVFGTDESIRGVDVQGLYPLGDAYGRRGLSCVGRMKMDRATFMRINPSAFMASNIPRITAATYAE